MSRTNNLNWNPRQQSLRDKSRVMTTEFSASQVAHIESQVAHILNTQLFFLKRLQMQDLLE